MCLVKKVNPAIAGFFIFNGMILTSAKHFIQPPQKIVSVVPSQTELLSYFSLEKEVCGITKFCIHPEQWYKKKIRVGGTKILNIEIIKNLQPDLVIANKEENVKEQVEELANHFNVWVTDVNTVKDALKMINDIGELTHKIREATGLIKEIKTEFSELWATIPITAGKKLRVCYLIWRNPYMTVGGNTFINDMLKYCRMNNCFEDRTRYPEITLQQLRSADCNCILLSSEPYPFTQKHLEELQQQLPGKKIILVDGEMFSWYGSRLLKAPAYFKHIWNQFEQTTG